VSLVFHEVLVVGGGIAGASTAIMLGRAGHRVTVVERDTQLRSSGSPVDVRGSASAWVERMGVAEQLREADTGVRRVEFVDESGRTRARAALRRSASADFEVRRKVLNEILVAAAAEVADLTRSDGPVRLVSDAGGVDVTFESGTESRYDVVVGADGQHSTVRDLSFGPEAEYSRPLGLGIATVPVDDALVAAPDVVEVFNVPGACMSVHPAGGHPVAAFIWRADDAKRPRRRAEQQRVLEQRFEGRGWSSPELLEAVRDGTRDLYCDIVSRVAVPKWSRDRVVLLGDAASSITILGEGCSMAITGAGRLAEALSDADDPAVAFCRYESVHRPEVTRKQRGAGFGACVLVPRTTRGIAARNLLVRVARRV
jgi:2-polyprenyl-6-methoxyphenol hydroxylase-like FAD-dependent oxidoreductase